MQNLRSNEGMINGSVTTESAEVIEEHAEAISFVGALCIPVSEIIINRLIVRSMVRQNYKNAFDLVCGNKDKM